MTEEDAGEFTISSPPSVPKSPSPAKKVDIHRETLLELLATERNYNADLDLVVEVLRSFFVTGALVCAFLAEHAFFVDARTQVWMAKLKESRMVEPADMSAIFSNIEQIRNLNKVQTPTQACPMHHHSSQNRCAAMGRCRCCSTRWRGSTHSPWSPSTWANGSRPSCVTFPSRSLSLSFNFLFQFSSLSFSLSLSHSFWGLATWPWPRSPVATCWP